MDELDRERKEIKDLASEEIYGCKRPDNMWQVFEPDGERPLEFFATANVMAIVIMIGAALSVVGLFALALWGENVARDVALNAAPAYATWINMLAWSAKVLSAAATGERLWHFWKSIPFLVTEMRRRVKEEGL